MRLNVINNRSCGGSSVTVRCLTVVSGSFQHLVIKVKKASVCLVPCVTSSGFFSKTFYLFVEVYKLGSENGCLINAVVSDRPAHYLCLNEQKQPTVHFFLTNTS